MKLLALTLTFAVVATLVCAVIVRHYSRRGSFSRVVFGLTVGKKYRRKAWISDVYIGFEPGTRFVTFYGRRGSKPWNPYKDDFTANDWIEA